MTIREQAKAQVFLDGKQAEAAIDSLKNKSKELKKELKKAFEIGDTKEINRLKRELLSVDAATRSLKKETYDYEAVLKNINGASYNELNKALRTVQSQMRKMKRTDAGYKEKEIQVKRLRTEITSLNNNTRATTSIWSRFSNGVNRNLAAITAIGATITGVAFSAGEFIKGLTGLDDSLANVMKTTGMARKEVRELYSEFNNLNTRTSKSVLLEYAEEAGRLGKKGKADVMEFVDVANKIGTALGDDLGNAPEAIREVGKLVNIYKVGEQYGVAFGEGMEKIGSAINEIAANSSASAGYQIDYLKRLSGTAKQAKITASEILGYSSVLDQNGQAVEMAATAQGKLMIDMFTKPAKYAEVAGLKLNEFTSLLKKDANEAFLSFLDGINGNEQGFLEMAKSLDELGVNGSRAVQVLTTLASNTENIRKEQVLANKAMVEGVSLSNEYNIKNNNLAGSWEKIQKKIRSIFVNTALIEKFEGTVAALAKSMENGSFDKFVRTFKNLTLATIAYITVQKLSNISLKKDILLRTTRNVLLKVQRNVMLSASFAQAKLTGNTIRANAAMKMLNRTTKLNPILLMVTALISAGIALYNYSKKLSTVKSATSDITKLYQKQGAELNNLFLFAKNAAEGTDERRKAIESINSKYGRYLDNLLTEKSTLVEIEKAQKRATGALISEIGVKVSKEKLEKEFAKIANEFDSEFSDFTSAITENYGPALLPNFLQEINSAIEEEIAAGGGKVERGILEFSNRARVIYDKYINEISRKTGYLKLSFSDFTDSFLDFAEFKVEKSNVITTLSGMIGAYTSMVNLHSAGQIIGEDTGLEFKYQAKINAQKERFAAELDGEKVHKLKLLNIDLWYLKEKEKTSKGSDKLKIKGQILDKEQEIKAFSNTQDKEVTDENALDIKHQEKINAQKERFAAELDKEKEHKLKLLNIELWYLKEKEKIAKGLDQLKLQGQILDKEQEINTFSNKQTKEEAAELLKKYETYEQARKRIEDEWKSEREKLKEAGGKSGNLKKLDKEYTSQLKGLADKNEKVTNDIAQLFADMSTKSVDELRKLANEGKQILDYLLSGKYKEGTFGISKEDFERIVGSPEELAKISEQVRILNIEVDKSETAFEQMAQGLKNLSDGKLLDGINLIKQGFSGISSAINIVTNSLDVLSTATGSKALSSIADGLTEVMDVANQTMEGAMLGMQVAGSAGAIVGGAIGLVTGVVDKLNAAHDKKKEREIARIQEQVDALKASYDALKESAEKAFGVDASNLIEQQKEVLEQQNINIQNQINAEREKKKPDQARIDALQGQIDANLKVIEEIREAQIDKILGTTWKNDLEAFANAYVEAFAAGEDRAEAQKNVVKNMLKGMANELLKTNLTSLVIDLREKMAAAMEDDVISDSEMDAFNKAQEAIYRKSEEQVAMLEKLNLGDSSAIAQTAKAGGFEVMSQDTAGELNGRFTAFQSSNEVIKLETIKFGLVMVEMKGLVLNIYCLVEEIRDNTNYLPSIDARLEKLEKYFKEL